MEQLFKHEGDCVWTDDEYKFMQKSREAWPNGCTATNFTDSSGNTIYFDTKPAAFGSMDLGIYTDELCIREYSDSEWTADSILKSQVCGGFWTFGNDDDRDGDGEDACQDYYDGYNDYNNNNGGDYDEQHCADQRSRFVQKYAALETVCDMCGGQACYDFKNYTNSNKYNYYLEYLEQTDDAVHVEENDWSSKNTVYDLEEELDAWNDAFDIFKQCLPCKAGALTNLLSGEEANQYGDRYDDQPGDGPNDDGGRRRRRRKMQEDSDGEEDGDFVCHDDADYYDVNQVSASKK